MFDEASNKSSHDVNALVFTVWLDMIQISTTTESQHYIQAEL